MQQLTCPMSPSVPPAAPGEWRWSLVPCPSSLLQILDDVCGRLEILTRQGTLHERREK